MCEARVYCVDTELFASSKEKICKDIIYIMLSAVRVNFRSSMNRAFPAIVCRPFYYRQKRTMVE